MGDLTDRSFAAFMEAAPDAMVCVTADGLIALVNAQADRLFGYRREDLIGQPVELLVPGALRTAHVRHRATYLADPRPRPMGAGRELLGQRRDGGTFPAEIALSAIDTGGGMLITAAIRDITERVQARAEQQRLRSENERGKTQARMLQAQRLENLGQLAGGIAHDFNNLLAVILNYATFVAEELSGATESDWASHCETARDDLEQIRRAGERAASLTRQLLAFARREVVRPQVLDLNTGITAVEDILRTTVGQQVDLVTSLAGDLWPVLADPGQLEQVLMNLALNARDAMPDGGTLTIETSNITVDEDSMAAGSKSPPGRHVRLRVSDTGTGMTHEVMEHAFEPFYTTKEKGSGSGLGLATVYGIVTQAGGDVHISSEPGTGTSVAITFPASEQAPARLPDAGTGRRAPAGETVLVVEDEPALREVTRRIFVRNGYQVITAGSGPEALGIARDHPGEIHLLVTDVVMPQMLGKEVAERMRLIMPGIEVLFMSGYARPVLASQGKLEPGVALVEKPFSEADLIAVAAQVLDSRPGGRRAAGGAGATPVPGSPDTA
jgi:PAS domain S-box-containing protein